MKSRIFAPLVMLLFLTGCAAQNQRVDWIEQRVTLLERRSNQLEEAHKELSGRYDHQSRLHQQTLQELRDQTATMVAAQEKNRQELKQLAGKLEEAEFVQRQQPRMTTGADALARANQQRITRIEDVLKLTPLTPPAGTPPPGRAEVAPVVPPENVLYAAAKQAFDQGDMPKAREGFSELLNQYPDSPNADNAMFWIGETHYRERWFEKAILEYQKVIEKYPKSNKLQAAMLKQGLAFFNLGDKTNARLILRRLVDTYPDASESRIAKQKLQEL